MILYLDIDGVLNNSASLAKRIEFDPVNVAAVGEVLEAFPECTVVISSSWRIFASVMEIRRYVKDAGGKWADRINGETKVLKERGHEIQEYQDRSGNQPYVILDDDCDMLAEQMDCFVKTDHKVGFTDWDADRAIRILEGQLDG